MIYISSSSIKSNKISESVKALAQNGFNNIELSGGTKLYADLEFDLLRLQDQFGLHYLCHNYFPPPETPFVLNLAALDEEVFRLSFAHVKKAIALSSRLGAEKFGFHAGFLIDIPLNQIGNPISKQQLFNREKAIFRFTTAIQELKEYSFNLNVQLYIENNVLSSTNFENFEHTNPFLFTDYESLKEVKVDGVLPLIDFAHLKVSAHVLDLDLKEELFNLIRLTDYIHLSENDGKSDQNKGIQKDSEIFNLIPPSELRNKVITLEIYDSLDVIKESFENLEVYLK